MDTKNKPDQKTESKETPKRNTNEVKIGEDYAISDTEASFLDTKILMTVQGWSYGSKWDDSAEEYVEDQSAFQVQCITMNEELGRLEGNTLKVHKKLSEDELNKMVGKTYLFTGIVAYYIKDRRKYVYSADSFTEQKHDGLVYEVQSSAEFQVSHMFEEVKNERKQRKDGRSKTVQVATGNSILQVVIKDGTRMALKNITLIETPIAEVQNLIGKMVKVSGITVFKGMNGVIYRTETIPTPL